jgi:hypothetical protein
MGRLYVEPQKLTADATKPVAEGLYKLRFRIALQEDRQSTRQFMLACHNERIGTRRAAHYELGTSSCE